MSMKIENNLRKELSEALTSVFSTKGWSLPENVSIQLAPPKQAAHGDLACNVAMMLAKEVGVSPREIATPLVESLGSSVLLSSAEVAGPGFINLRIKKTVWHGVLRDILMAGGDYIRSNAGQGRRVLVEFVSANPTGPLHVAHGRGAVMGDIVTRLLRVSGHDVKAEYYVNDLGNQVDVMARSVFIRYQELFGRSPTHPSDFYPGNYIEELAKAAKEKYADEFLDKDEAAWLSVFKAMGIDEMMTRIRLDLADFGVQFDSFVSERELTDAVDLEAFLSRLEASGAIYTAEGKKWFKSTDYGDDKDRVVFRDDGRPTYFASDIAYHDDKLKRGFTDLINVWGADHGGYIRRVKAGIEALGYSGDPLQVLLVQIVSLVRAGQSVRMGKRLGNAIWLRDVLDEVGKDAIRYFFAMRRGEAQMELDVELATKKNNDNPVYYAQMGHARMAAIERKAVREGLSLPSIDADLSPLVLDDEIELIKQLGRAAEVVAYAAEERAPHKVVHYVQELIASFHSYYSKYRNTEKVITEDKAKTDARLLLCRGLKTVLKALFEDVLGIDAPEEMYFEEPQSA